MLNNVIRGFFNVLVGLLGLLGGYVLIHLAIFEAPLGDTSIDRTAFPSVKEVVEASSGRVDPANEGRPIHVTGQATARGALSDPDYGVVTPEPALMLVGVVEMYQWEERVKDPGYACVWSSKRISSDHFQDSTRTNPDPPLVGGRRLRPGVISQGGEVSLGAFSLPARSFELPELRKPVNVDSAALSKAPLGKFLRVYGDRFYFSKDPKNPGPGDVRISFSYVAPQTVSVVATQRGSWLGAAFSLRSLWTMQSNPGDVYLFQPGSVAASTMLEAAVKAREYRNEGRLLRTVGRVVVKIVMCFAGGMMILVGLIAVTSAFFPSLDVAPAASDSALSPPSGASLLHAGPDVAPTVQKPEPGGGPSDGGLVGPNPYHEGEQVARGDHRAGAVCLGAARREPSRPERHEEATAPAERRWKWLHFSPTNFCFGGPFLLLGCFAVFAGAWGFGGFLTILGVVCFLLEP